MILSNFGEAAFTEPQNLTENFKNRSCISLISGRELPGVAFDF
jgi:hypothetical protein